MALKLQLVRYILSNFTQKVTKFRPRVYKNTAVCKRFFFIKPVFLSFCPNKNLWSNLNFFIENKYYNSVQFHILLDFKHAFWSLVSPLRLKNTNRGENQTITRVKILKFRLTHLDYESFKSSFLVTFYFAFLTIIGVAENNMYWIEDFIWQ